MNQQFLAHLKRYLALYVYSAIIFAAYYTIKNGTPVPIEPPDKRPYDIFVISAYFYSKSESLGDNSVALVLTGDFEVLEDVKFLRIAGWNNETVLVKTVPFVGVTPHQVCRWIAIYASTTLLPNLDTLAINGGNRMVQIPFTRAATSLKHDVLFCISPLFANEQWQQALVAVHIYRRFGAHIHLYVQSAITSLMEIMKIYEDQSYLTIQPWLKIRLSNIREIDFNPNINIEFRNQAAAQTDCLLQYKESASFISFLDLDDILIPRLGSSYFEEFTHLFHVVPNAAYLHYEKQNVAIQAHRNPDEFSLSQVLGSIKYLKRKETGKYVTRPKFINSTWIHWPTNLPQGMTDYTVPVGMNSIVHLKKTKFVNYSMDFNNLSSIKYIPHRSLKDAILISERDVARIEKEFISMKSTTAPLMTNLPHEFIYHKIIDECFHKTFYKYDGTQQYYLMKCPGPNRCKLPDDVNFPCYNANAKYYSAPDSTLNIHFHSNATFANESRCKN